MKTILIITIILSFIACKENNSASYDVDPNHNKLDEQQFSDFVISNNDSLDKESANNKIKKEFSYETYFRILNQRLKNNTNFSLPVLKRISKTVSFHCDEKTVPLQLDILQTILVNMNLKKLIKTKKGIYVFNLLKDEQTFLKNCSMLSNNDLLRLKEIHSVIFTLPNREMMKNLDLITKLDDEINSKLGVSNNFSSFTPAELSQMINLLAKTTNLEDISTLISLHKKISPLSELDRSQIIIRSFDSVNGIKIIKNSSLKSITTFLGHYLDLNIVHNQDKVKQTILIAINKLSLKYKKVTRFEDVSEILQTAWVDYQQVYAALNSKKITDKAFIITTFGNLNLLMESIYELPINRTPAIRFLEAIHGRYESLALFHLTRLKSTSDKAQLLSDYNHVNRITIFNGPLDELLRLRSGIFIEGKSHENLKKYCDYINSVKFKRVDYKKVNDINSIINNRNTFGCFELNSNEHLISEPDRVKDKKFVINIIKKNIKSPIDLVIKAVDTDLKIITDYYSGPIWYLPTSRAHKKRDNIKTDLDSSTSILVIEATILKNDKKFFKNDKVRIFHNYNLKTAQAPRTEQQYLGSMALHKGFRGGNVEVTVKNSTSIYPTILSPGGAGQQGPDTVFPGNGINEEIIYNVLFNDDNLEYYNSLLYENPESTPVIFNQSILEKISQYEFKLTINKDLTEKLHNDLCREIKKENLHQLCYIVGDKFQYRDIESTNLRFLSGKIKESFHHAIRILKNNNTVGQLIQEIYNFPPQSNDSVVDAPLVFSNGLIGDDGKLDFTIIN